MGLDLGGTNFRVLHVKLKNGVVVSQKFNNYDVDTETRQGEGTALFDFLADCVSDFAHKEGVADKVLTLGFTFSFPMHQKSLHNGILTQWTKSFSATGVIGHDVVVMLQEALERRGDVNVRVNAILNDTTGTLLQGCAMDQRTRVGLILGTGSNAAYLERADRVCHWESERHGEKEIVIDIEWGAFGDNGTIDFCKSHFDRQLDNGSLHINSFSFEKYISGLYLGELVRIVLLHLANNRLLFNGILSKKIQVKDSFLSSYVSRIEKDTVDTQSHETESILQQFDLTYNDDDVNVLKYVCELISLRASLLVSACCARLLKQMDKPDVTFAVDGSVFKFHPRYRKWMEIFIGLLAPNYKFQLLLAEDGSGKGAAIASAIASRLEKTYH
ncbi:unnamed protein product [Nesidiocoris tenuis]|uniref:Phosphotransferase n=1 Tax=Nesidiocoris tenuis TaxID=355587 RepID=A0A6H5HED2_9HEMI|nr:unnamed protein product [Nesidiocoris tenuis]